jgi:hypothetical protein
MPVREPPIALVFHPVRTSSSQGASDAFAAAVKSVLDAAPGKEVCLDVGEERPRVLIEQLTWLPTVLLGHTVRPNV